MTNWFGKTLLSAEGTLNPELARYCQVVTLEQRPYEPTKMEVRLLDPIDMDKLYVNQTAKDLAKFFSNNKNGKNKTHRERDIVERVVHNPPATIVFWKDKTKTVVKQQDGDVYDPEHGFMAACTKKLFGNDNQFNYEIKWHVPKQVVKDDVIAAESTNVEFGVEYTGPKC